MRDLLPHNFRPVASAGWIDPTIEVLLAALLVTMPFALGVVAPWSETIVISAVAAITVLLAARAWLPQVRQQTLAWAMTPVMLFIAVAAAQLLPLPASLVGVVSPHTLAVRAQLLGDLPGAAGLLRRATLSFYPAASAHELRLVLVYTVIFLAVVTIVRREQQYVRLLWAVTVSGGAAAILALLQDLSGTDKIYWTLDSGLPAATGGPFVSYSNYSQYINLCTGAALGLLLYTLRRDDIVPAKGSSASRKPRAGWQVREFRSWRTWLPMAVASLGCLTLCLSRSRGGMLSLMCAGALTVLMLARRRGMRGAAWVLVVLLLAAFTCLLYVGFDMVCDRLATLKNAPDPSAGRIQTFKDILVEWRQFPVFGTGLGTHEYVYPMFDRSSDPLLAEYADSDYFQILEEMGVVGVALVLSFAGYVWFCYAKAIRRGRPRLNVIAYGLGFGLLAVMLQSMTDFGQHLPSIGCISALFCGMLLNLSRAGRRGEAVARNTVAAGAKAKDTPDAASPGWRLPRIALPAGLAVGMVWAVAGADATRRSQAAADRASVVADRLEPYDWKGSDADYQELFQEADAAVAADPSNVKTRYQLACYRWRRISRWADNDVNNGAPAGSEPAGSTPTADNLAENDPSETDQPENDRPEVGAANESHPAAPSQHTEAADEIAQVMRDLDAARMACPTFGPAYAVAGQIEWSVMKQPAGLAHVRTAYALAPAQPDVCLVAAQLDACEGKFDDSLKKARRCLSMDPSFHYQVIELYFHTVDRPDLAVAAMGEDRERLFHLYDELRDESLRSDRASVKAAMAEARNALMSSCDRDDAPAWTLATLGALLRDEEDYSHAITYYRRALQRQYADPNWHLSLASLLAEAGQNDEAVYQAEICLHLRPQMKEALQLIQEVNSRHGGVEAHGSASVEAEPTD